MTTAARPTWDAARELLRQRGLRWTPQRRALIGVLSASSGHVTATQLLDRVRAVDPTTAPSTVYRTLDTLEELGLVQHTHGAAGREEYHLLPGSEHGHVICERCGANVELSAEALGQLTATLLRGDGFRVEASHVTVGGLCATCAADAAG
jgi:Fur family ferric uptake transcriptional regulator